jgi:hypothetical protein
MCINLSSSEYCSISYCSLQVFTNDAIVSYTFDAPCFPCELVYCLMSGKGVNELEFIKEAKVY